MNPDEVEQLISIRMSQSWDTLKDARLLADGGGNPRSVVNRAYYAAFYAVLALLQSIGRTPRKHRDAIGIFDVEFMRRGHFAKAHSRILHDLFDQRQEDDYERLDAVTAAEAAAAVTSAEQFMRAVQTFLGGRVWQSGKGKTTTIGYENPNGQRCCGHRGVKETDHGQYAYKIECSRCGHVYGANGSDLHERRCPQCQSGKPGIPF